MPCSVRGTLNSGGRTLSLTFPHPDVSGPLIASAIAAGLACLIPSRLPTSPRLRRGTLVAYLAAVWGLLAFAEIDRTVQVQRSYSEHLNEPVYLYRLGIWARDNLPEDVVMAGFDSGIFTYFSERTVISLEGLVSERAYLETGRWDKLRYLMENDVEYVIGPGHRFEDGSYRFAYLPTGSYEIEWVPYPDVPFWAQFGWNNTHMIVVPHYAQERRHSHPQYAFGAVGPPANRDGPGLDEF